MFNASLTRETINPIISIECPICLDPVHDKSYIVFEKCLHTYHIDCINIWRSREQPLAQFIYRCPSCCVDRNIDVEKSMFQLQSSRPITNISTREPVIRKIMRCIWPFSRNNS